jgi:NADPH2 dehydrogenase
MRVSLILIFVLDMREPHPEETFGYLVSKIRDGYPNLAYIHAIDPLPLEESDTTGKPGAQLQRESNDFIRDIWQPRPLIAAGGFTGASAKEIVEEKDGLVAFGRHFIANVGCSALS